MPRIPPAPAFAAMCAMLLVPGTAWAQGLGLNLGGTVKDLGSTVGGVGGAVGGVVGGVVGGATDALDTVGGAVDPLDSSQPLDTPAGAAGASTLTQESAIKAVSSHRALPLEQIITLARLQTNGEIVDAQLIAVKGFLLYQIKVVEEGGDVGELYFYAQSGELVRSQ